MNKIRHSAAEPNPTQLLDQIYDIALDPSRLSEFIETWHAANEIDQPDSFETFDTEFGAHLQRAQVFLGSVDATAGIAADRLKPFDGLTACIVGADGRILEANGRASARLHAVEGATLENLRLDQDTTDTLRRVIRRVLRDDDGAEQHFRGALEDRSGAMLLRVSALEPMSGGPRSALVVVTDFQWNASINHALQTAFGLTEAEQSVVRLLVDGHGARAIADTRSVREGTVRGQIKSILGKMELRSKTDLIRLVMPLAILPNDASEVSTPWVSKDWSEREVWKPFQAFDTPTGRRLTYHEMGPAEGHPVLLSHMGSCMVRWPQPLLRAAFEHHLRVICPIRAGYGDSAPHDTHSDLFAATREDTLSVLDELGVDRLPYAAQGTDFPLAVDFAARHPDRITAILGIGGSPCLPGGASSEARGDWQRFFVRAARSAPNLAGFAAAATMAMSRRIGSAKMLRVLCKDSPADLALIEDPDMAAALTANLDLMARKDSHAAAAFAREYVAFYDDWSDRMEATRHLPVQVFLAAEDPTTDLNDLPALQTAYPWVDFNVVENAGLALTFQHYKTLIPALKGLALAAGNVGLHSPERAELKEPDAV